MWWSTGDFSSYIAFPIAAVLPGISPAYLLFGVELLREHDWSYTIQEHEPLFNKIHNVELHFLRFVVPDCKIKPLAESLGIGVVLQNEVELRSPRVGIFASECVQEVTRFESRIKDRLRWQRVARDRHEVIRVVVGSVFQAENIA